MKTLLLTSEDKNIDLSADVLRSGGIVAFPTETVYGLGGSAFSETAIQNIFKAKGRPSDNPLIVHVSSKAQIESLVDKITPSAEAIIKNLMPGPVTIVLKKKPIVPDNVTGGLDTVAIRMPDSKIALKLIESAGVPICAPSANTSTKPSPTSAKHVMDDLNGKIDIVLDGGECSVGVESTVIDCTSKIPVILRQGGLEKEKIEQIIGRIDDYKTPTSKEKPRSPGMKYKHYSPRAEVYCVPNDNDFATKVTDFFTKNAQNGKKCVIIGLQDTLKSIKNIPAYNAGCDIKDYAKNLFKLLRLADDDGYDFILAELPEEKSLGRAVKNRLTKASGGKTL